MFAIVATMASQMRKMSSIFSQMTRVLWRTAPRVVTVRILLVFVLALLPYLRAFSFGSLVDWARVASPLAEAALPFIGLGVAWIGSNILDNVRVLSNRLLNSHFESHLAVKGPERRELIGMQCFDDPATRNLLKSAEDGEWRSRGYYGSVLDLLSQLISVLGAAIITFIYLPAMGVVLLVGASVSLIMQIKIASEFEKMERSMFEQTRRSDWMRNVFRRDQHDLRTIMLFGMGPAIRRLIGLRVEELEQKKQGIARYAAARSLWSEGALGLSLLGAVGYLLWQVQRGTVSVGELSFLLVSLLTFASSLGSFADSFGRQAEVAHSLTDLFALLDRNTATLPEPQQPVTLPQDKPLSVRLDGVTFGYTRDPVFQKLSATFPAGQMTWLLGANGVGKSTLYSLLGRLYDPSEGSVMIDGVNARSIATADLRRSIRIVTQTAFKPLLPVELAMQLGQHCPTPTQDNSWRALDLACFGDRVRNFPHQLQEDLGPWVKGRPSVSGGEWRKLHIAMGAVAAFEGCGVLVLDEPTAEVDPVSSQQIIKNLRGLENTTRIISTHQVDLIGADDPVVFLELVSEKPRTVVAHAGTFAELQRSCPAFAVYCAVKPEKEAA